MNWERTWKMAVAVVVTLTAPIWIVPLLIFGSIWESCQSMYKLLWGDK